MVCCLCHWISQIKKTVMTKKLKLYVLGSCSRREECTCQLWVVMGAGKCIKTGKMYEKMCNSSQVRVIWLWLVANWVFIFVFCVCALLYSPNLNAHWTTLTEEQALCRLPEIWWSRQTRFLPSWWKWKRRQKIKQAIINMMICVILKNQDLQSLYCYLRFYTPFLGLE